MKIEDFNKAKDLLREKEKLIGEIQDLNSILECAERPYVSSKIPIYLDASVYNPSRFTVNYLVFEELIESEIKTKETEVSVINKKFEKLGE